MRLNLGLAALALRAPLAALAFVQRGPSFGNRAAALTDG
eukprot:CAMPEP_0183319064 /NCGR_PEP_ID=MMETSP0160_2-20130417/62485_1 /TAXON_ID=2839 ORGANISM="Odontella Sinensis, Strain Grunow 1884" /NCGR_SAMPLE_ID=MMETSP0160_2 /ASSEMBLY_ACC=CAM_ASM_000250 /LENGTH=38 /DNA_ID= /DNA_START= /DNA_END= /DNA_ORIENTATION=